MSEKRSNSKGCFDVQFGSQRKNAWKDLGPIGDMKVRWFTSEANCTDLIAYQRDFLIGR